MTNDLLVTIFKPIIPYALVLISVEIVYLSVLMIFYYRSNYYKDDYPPEGYEEAMTTVIQQCEMWTDNI